MQKIFINNLFDKNEKPIGQYIKVNNINFKVIGVYKRSNGISFDGDAAYIPFTTYQQIYNMGDKIHWMMITAHDGVDIKQMEKDILLTLKNLHKVHPDDKRAFGSVNLRCRDSKIYRVFNRNAIFNLVCWYCNINCRSFCNWKHSY